MNDGTVERILDTAQELIAERGVYGMSFGEIALGVGVSKGTLSYYFPTKQALTEAAAKCAIKSISDSLFAWVDSVDPKADPEAPIRGLCDALLGRPLRVFIAVNGAAEPGSELEEALDSALNEWTVMIDVGAMRMRPETADRMKRMSAAILPFVSGLAALNADPDYAKDAFVAIIMG